MSNSTSMICPNCHNLISTEEDRCPYCGTYKPNLWGIGSRFTKIFSTRIDIINLIPAVCIGLYLLSLLLDLNTALNTSGGIFDMLSPGGRALYALGMTGGLATYQDHWWTVLTATYLHGSLLHVLFNILWIRQLGPEVGNLYGPTRYFIIFTTGGVVGFIVSNLFSNAPTIGASGAIFGLLAALIVYGRNQRGNLATMMTRQVWQWAIFLFIFGFLMSGVNNWAHLGGFIGGWISSQLSVGKRESRGAIFLALVLLILTAISFGLSLFHNWPMILA